jgi:hypothetical protein
MIDKVSRSTIFRHLDGLVTAPVAHSLHKRGVLLLDKRKSHSMNLLLILRQNEGYLNVGLRVLCSKDFSIIYQ